MTPFKFPPPPPPPPKATASDAQEQYSSQRGGLNNGRGGGRGRGWQARGRGNNFRGNARGGHGSGSSQGENRHNQHTQHNGDLKGGYESNDQGNPPHKGGSRGGYQRGRRGGGQQQRAPQSQPQQHYQQPPVQQALPPANIPTNGYANPPSPNQMRSGEQTQAQVDPMAFAQAMAFISTPAGMQTMAAFASQMANPGTQPYVAQVPPSCPPQQATSPQSNKKRKRNERAPESRPPRASPSARDAQPKQKPPRAKVAPPPVIPSFGFALPTLPPSQPSNRPQAGKREEQGKRKVHLGLTHNEEDELENSTEEDIDEEAAYASKGDFQGATFEYEGQNISLQTPAELAAWVKDRRKQYPTRKRIAEKAQEAAERRAGELEFLRRVQGKKTRGDRQADRQAANIVPEPSSGKRRTSMKKNDTELDDLRKRVQESVLANRMLSSSMHLPEVVPPNSKPRAVDLGLGYGSESGLDEDESSVLSDSSVLSSSEESSEESESDSNDSDAAPVEESSKVAPPTINVPPPMPTPAPTERKKRDGPPICFEWEKHGNCRHGDRCRYPHPLKVEKHMGLYERLIEQEKDKADRLALDAIKYLGRNGFLG